MSRHWNPDRDLARARDSAPKPHWPHGATVGVALVAAACLGMAILLYQLAGPRDIFGS
jgi:hypothetical protein